MATNRDIACETYELFSYCRDNGHIKYLEGSELALRYYASRQWLTTDVDKRTAEGRLAFTVNEVFRTVNAVVGEMSQLSSDIRFDPGTGEADADTAIVLNKLSDHIDRLNKSYINDQAVLLHGLLTGRAFYEQRIVFDDNMQGHIKQCVKRPQNVVLDADIDSPNRDDWNRIFTTEIVSLDDIEALYGKRLAKDMQGAPYPDWISIEDRTLAETLGINTPYRRGGIDNLMHPSVKQHRLINHQYRVYKMKEFFIDLETGDTSEIPESWSYDRIAYAKEQYGLGIVTKKAKTIRWRVVCNDRVLHDEDSPYNNFTIVPFFPFFIDGVTLSLFDVLKGPQDMLNYTVSEEAHILGTTSHSGWKIKHNSLKNMSMRQLEQKGAKNGLVLELDDVQDAEKIQPGSPPSGFERLGDRARNWIQELANVTPTMLGTQRADASGKGMQSQLSRAPVNLSIPLIAFQAAKHSMAEQKLDLIQGFYTETRILKIAPSAYAPTEEITINQPDPAGQIANDVTLGKYIVRMLPTGSRLASDEFAFDELVQLKEMGVNVPNNVLLAVSSINAKAEVIEQLRAANNGDVSPEEQQAREIELAQMEADLQDALEGIEVKRANKILALARAQRAHADAQYDPRKEANQLNKTRLLLEDQRYRRDQDINVQNKNKDVAVDLAKMSFDANKPEPKPAATKKPAKKAPKK